MTSAARRIRIVGGQRVREALYGRIHGPVNDVLPILESDHDYDAADLCGSTFRASLQPGRQQQVNPCLADLAARGALPLTPLRVGADGAPRYRLTQTPCSRGECSPRLSVLGTATLIRRPDGASRRCRRRLCRCETPGARAPDDANQMN